MKNDLDNFDVFTTPLAIELKWANSLECVTITPSALKPGDVVSTYDTYIRGGGDGFYTASCLRSEYLQSDDVWIIELGYTESQNKELAKEFDVEWGNVEITISRDLQASKVIFYPADSLEPCTVKCKIQTALTAVNRTVLVEVLARPAQNRVRDLLLKGPEAWCAITGTTLHTVLDAAHVIDLGKDGATTLDNMLLLRADIHRLFDADLIRINPETGAIDATRLAQDGHYASEIPKWLSELSPGVLERVGKALRIRSESINNGD